MNAIQIFFVLLGCCGVTCTYIWTKFKWMVADFETGLRHAMQCAFCDLKMGVTRAT